MEGDKGLGETPIIINVQFSSPKDIKKFVYTPRQDDNPNGQILKYSMNGTTMSGEEVVLVAHGEWADNHSDKEVVINQDERLVSVKMTITEGSFQGQTSSTAATAAEFTFYEEKSTAKMNKDSLALTTGEDEKLSMIDVQGNSISWSSSNTNVASVSENEWF